MKVTTNKKEQAFEPIELTITIENIDELKYLCAITHQKFEDVYDGCVPSFKFNYKRIKTDLYYELRDAIDSYYESKNELESFK